MCALLYTRPPPHTPQDENPTTPSTSTTPPARGEQGAAANGSSGTTGANGAADGGGGGSGMGDQKIAGAERIDLQIPKVGEDGPLSAAHVHALPAIVGAGRANAGGNRSAVEGQEPCAMLG